jgi:hypothetical protein
MERTPDQICELETLKKVQFYVYPAIFVFSPLSLVAFRDRVPEIWALNPFLVTTWAACIIALVGFWISATTHEFQLWQRYICHVFIRQQVYAAMYGIAFVLGTLLVFAIAFNIVVFTAFFSTCLLVNYWTQWVKRAFPKGA